MNKIDFAKINKKEDMILAFNQLKDDYSIAFQQIQELTNNWNELEELLKKEAKDYGRDIDVETDHCASEFIRGNSWEAQYILDKMKEIKGNK